MRLERATRKNKSEFDFRESSTCRVIAGFFGFAMILVVIGVARPDDNTRLKLVTVVFRHGDRTPENAEFETYPTDPYKHETYPPFGVGQLTNIGKRRSYSLGTMLRKRYDEFLGDVYTPDTVYARSTDVVRTKMSVLLVLAGLYPPGPSQRWHETLMWQPIPYDYVPIAQDQTMMSLFCPTYVKELAKFMDTDEYRSMSSEYDELRRNLSRYTGANLTTMIDLSRIYGTLNAQSLMGLPLPDWTKEYYPDSLLKNATIFSFETTTYNRALRNRNAGKLLRRIVEDMNDSVTDRSSRMIGLYSGHDINVFGLYKSLGFSDSFLPQFSSAVIVELHKSGCDHFVKILRYLGVPAILEEVTIPGCRSLCPYDDFLSLTSDSIPDDDEMACSLD